MKTARTLADGKELRPGAFRLDTDLSRKAEGARNMHDKYILWAESEDDLAKWKDAIQQHIDYRNQQLQSAQRNSEIPDYQVEDPSGSGAVIARHKDMAEAYYLAGKFLYSKNRYAEALAKFRECEKRLVDRDPGVDHPKAYHDGVLGDYIEKCAAAESSRKMKEEAVRLMHRL